MFKGFKAFVYGTAVGLGLTLIFSGLPCLLSGGGNFWNVFLFAYLLLGGAPAAWGLITWLFPQYEEISFGLGCGFWYGGLGCCILFQECGVEQTDIIVITGFVISGLVCTICAKNWKQGK